MEKYYALFSGRDNHLYRWSVAEESYQGVAKRLTLTAAGITIEEDNDEDPMTPVRSWTGYANLLDDGLASELIARNAKALPFRIVRTDTGETQWCGYITPESRSQTYPTMMSEVSIPLRGRLTVAGGYYIEKYPSGQVTLGNLLRESLLLCGFSDQDTLDWPDDLYTPDADGTTGLHLLALTVAKARFYVAAPREEVEGDKKEIHYAESAQVVIGEIMKLFGFTLYERGNHLQATGKGARRYRTITLGQLQTLTAKTNVASYPTTTAITTEMSTLETEEQYTTRLQGKRGVTVSVEMDRAGAESLPPMEVSQFGYLGTYNRIVGGKDIGTDYRSFHHIQAHLNHSDNVQTYVYQKTGTGWAETDINNWLNSAGKLDDAVMGGESQRTGMFPARIAAYTDKEMEEGSLKNYEYVDGYIFNPCIDEQGRDPVLDKTYKLLRIRDTKGVHYRGGTFVIDFLMGGWSSNTLFIDSPCETGVTISLTLRVGDHYWNGSEWIKETQGEVVFPIPLERKEARLLNYATCGPVDQKTINMPYNNASGYFAELKDQNGAPLELSGDIEITLWIDATNPVHGSPFHYFELILSNLTINYLQPDDEMERSISGSQQDHRTLHRRTTSGFDQPDANIHLKLGSYAYDSGAALCTLSYDGKSIRHLRRLADNKKLPPEEILLGNLITYYDRIVERRELTVRQNEQPPSTTTITMDGKEWRQVAISDNYGAGLRLITLEDA